MSARPAIGICTALETASWGTWEGELTTLSPRSYSLAVQAAGAMSLLLPPDDAVAERPDEVLDLVDGLMLAGGSDVDPASTARGRTPRRARAGPSATASSWR